MVNKAKSLNSQNSNPPKTPTINLPISLKHNIPFHQPSNDEIALPENSELIQYNPKSGILKDILYSKYLRGK